MVIVSLNTTHLRAYLFAGIQGIPEFLDIVVFLDAPLNLSIYKFHQKLKELEFLNSQRTFETFQVLEF